MKFVYKGGQSRRRNKGTIASPLARAEFIFNCNSRELTPLKEISILETNFSLRSDLDILQISCHWLHLIRKTQLPGKPSRALYQLLCAYLKALPLFSTTQPLFASFHLKLLRHEGVIEISPHCCQCHAPIQETLFQKGESFCRLHTSQGSTPFTQKEARWLNQLAYCKSLKEIESLELSGAFVEKVTQLYKYISAS